MKIITINTHSLEEPDYERKLHQFAAVILAEKPDIFAMQEVNQSVKGRILEPSQLTGYVSCGDFSKEIRQDNHAARLAGLLLRENMAYDWTWVPAKLGYGKYDEGLAIFSRQTIWETDSFRISRCKDYENWKTRRILGVRTDSGWFYTVHMGWWDDKEEPFSEQWKRLEEHLKPVRCKTSPDPSPIKPDAGTENRGGRESPVWLMGDFNSLDRISGEGYDLVSKSGWKDTYRLARERDCGITVGKMIDGWRERLSDQKVLEGRREEAGDFSHGQNQEPEGMRIDYIWCSHEVPVLSSHVICNGERYPVVSDHYGVMVVV